MPEKLTKTEQCAEAVLAGRILTCTITTSWAIKSYKKTV